jgi:exodeoxyribonuclease VII small subunit
LINQRLLECLFEWLTALPVAGPRPQHSQILDMVHSSSLHSLRFKTECIVSWSLRKLQEGPGQGVYRTLGSGESSVTFTEDMKRLQEIVETLDSEAMPLEESLSLFEEGIGLVKRCRLFLNETGQKIQLLSEDADDVVGSEWNPREEGEPADEG